MENKTTQTSQEVLSQIGQTLKDAREKQGITCAEVSARLRITQRYIEALEAGATADLPAMTYVIGYVRSYGNLLGLDAAHLCATLKQSLSVEENKPDFDFIEQRSQQNANTGRTALAALVAGIMIYGGWYAVSTGMIFAPKDETVLDQKQIAEVAAPVLTDDAPEAGQDTEQLETPEVVEPTFTKVEPKTVQDGETPAADEQILAEDKIELAGQEPAGQEPADADAPVLIEDTSNNDLETASVEAETALPATSSELSPRVTDAVATNRIPEEEIMLKATANSWVEVTRADGSAVTQRLMREGETYIVPSGDDLFLTTGNAGGLQIQLGDAEAVTLGGWGEAIRELALDHTIISQRY